MYARVAIRGYVDRDVPALMKPLVPSKAGTNIVMKPVVVLPKVQHPAVSLGVHVRGAALPIPDPLDGDTAQRGARHRFCRDTPPISRCLRLRLRLFVRQWLKDNLEPLPPDSDVSFETWLRDIVQPLARKQELQKVYDEKLGVKPTDYFCKSFVKREFYTAYKHARMINARSDRFKVLTGPYFKKIEEKLYSNPAFIKHVPVADRPEYIENTLSSNGGRYAETDHTAFEAHMTAHIMKAVEFQLYDYMLPLVCGGIWVLAHIKKALAGLNTSHFVMMMVQVFASRMSGDMCTSLGNGLPT